MDEHPPKSQQRQPPLQILDPEQPRAHRELLDAREANDNVVGLWRW